MSKEKNKFNFFGAPLNGKYHQGDATFKAEDKNISSSTHQQEYCHSKNNSFSPSESPPEDASDEVLNQLLEYLEKQPPHIIEKFQNKINEIEIVSKEVSFT